MSGPTVVVDWAPEGWTHIGGPGMHLLIGLHEEDEQTLQASDAADGGDLDDVLEVLTAGGMRRARHFVGVHTGDTTRVVAFGPVAAVVTLADGSEHDVRATSARVWADLDLPDAPERIVLRVLDELEREQPAPPQTLTSAGPVAAPAPAPARAADAVGAADATDAVDATEDTSTLVPSTSPPVPPTAAPKAGADEPDGTAAPDENAEADGRGPGPDAAPPAVPTFGAPAAAAEPGRATSSWGRSWARRDEPEAPTSTNSTLAQSTSTPSPEPVAPSSVDPVAAEQDSSNSAPALRSWDSARPAVAPVRSHGEAVDATSAAIQAGPRSPSPVQTEPAAAEPTFEVLVAPAPPVPEDAGSAVAAAEPAAPVAADLPPSDASRDFESTWASRPEAPEEPKAAAANATPRPVPAAPDVPTTADASDADDDAAPAAPSYDYLFGHTTAVDEHRRVLAELTKVDQGDDHHDDHADHQEGPGTLDAAPVAPPVADAAPAPVTNPVPEAPEAPAAPAQPVPGTSGGLISAVPWATSSPAPPAGPAPTPAEAPVDPPTFSGRHTPPPAPSLLPPVHTPPPGIRAPQATPLISTGPPPAATPQATRAPTATGPTPTPPTPVPAAPAAAPAAPSAPSARPAVPPTQPIPTGDPSRAVPHDTPRLEQHHTPRLAAPTEDLDEVDEAEQTVDRSALLEARHAAQLANPTGPSVLAVLCASGHPTPPHGDACRVCGASIPPQEPFTMPRPPLGVLRLSTGDVVTLDRSVLLGRSPKLGDGVAATDRPHVVKVPSPERDVSRNHVEVLLEGWHVLVRDLGTTNGTTMALPGEAPVRLRANDQQVLEPGSVVSMADEVSFTFEAAL